MSSLWKYPAAELLRDAASAEPTPGGGSVAALSAAFGAGLLRMALDISYRRAQKRGEDAQGAASGRDALQPCLERLQALADEDVAVFKRLMQAWKSKGAGREEALALASADARQVPLDIARECLRALDIAAQTLDSVHQQVMSDSGAGAALLRGAAQAALLTLDINLQGLPEDERGRWQRQREELSQAVARRSASILEEVNRRLAP